MPPPPKARPAAERARPARPSRVVADRLVAVAEHLLGEEISARLARIPVPTNDAGVDPFGFDPVSGRSAVAVAAFFHRLWFRSHVHGIEHVPEGRVLVVANHSGQLPIDGVVLSAALVMDAEPPRFPRGMVDWWVAELPFVSALFPRIGQVTGRPENARRLLEQGEALLVFPEGTRGISKPFSERYQLADFGLGFMRLALETRTPILPVGIVGAEEQYPSVANLRGLGRALGMPAFPLIPQFLVGMWLPLPVRYHIHVGEPLSFQGDPDDDDAVIEEKVWVVKTAVERLIRKGLAERRGWFA